VASETSYKWVRHDGGYFYDVGVNDDGSLHNPNGYPADLVRAAIAAAEERQHQRRKTAAAKAAKTRQARKEKRVYHVARRIVAGEAFGPGDACFICGRGLDDPQSIERGIGSECWQGVLGAIEELAGRRIS
jgi:hypothetical protein